MITTLDQFYDATISWVHLFDAWASPYSDIAHADHICFKCESAEVFEQMRSLFESESGYVYQTLISGRRIATIRLPRAISTSLGEIWHLELSDQKPDGSQVNGFDHIEIYPRDGSASALAEQLSQSKLRFEKTERPHHTTWDAVLSGTFKVRIEPEPLIETIKTELT